MSDTPTPMARAVEAMTAATPEHCAETCNECLDTMLRAALPALLEAVIGALSQAETRALEAEILRINANVPYMTDEAQPNALIRRALLAALTSAAGRVG